MRISSPPKIGLRTIKTSISVFICVLIFSFFNTQHPFYACIAAIICTKETVSNSFDMGKHRMLGTIVGGTIGILFILINSKLPIFHTDAYIVAIGILVTIYFCNILNLNSSVQIACIVFCAIMVNLRDESAYVYALSRILETFVGIIISLLVNKILPGPNILDDAE